jgi:hypothetical protein
MPRTGAQHLDLSIVNADNTFAGVFQDVPGVTPGINADFRVWHKSTTAPLDVKVEVRIEWRSSISNTEIARTPNSAPIPTSVYTQFSLSAAAPVGADLARIVYAIETFSVSATNTGTVFLDDASFTLGDPLPGDFDGDFDIDLADYLNLSSHLLTNVSSLTPEQSYALGDFNSDLKINLPDFVGFRAAYDNANGLGAFVAMLQFIPEPTSAVLAFGMTCILGLHRRSCKPQPTPGKK